MISFRARGRGTGNGAVWIGGDDLVDVAEGHQSPGLQPDRLVAEQSQNLGAALAELSPIAYSWSNALA
jgi:hypothetical protein